MSRRRKPVDPSRVGLFARYILPEQRRGLRRMDWSDLRFEQSIHRYIAALVAPLLIDQLTRPSPDSKEIIALTRALTMNTTATASAARAHERLNTGQQRLDDILSSALELVPFDLPSQSRDEEPDLKPVPESLQGPVPESLQGPVPEPLQGLDPDPPLDSGIDQAVDERSPGGSGQDVYPGADNE